MTEDAKKWVFIKVQDKDWNILSSFEAEQDVSILWQSNHRNCEIPLACGSWACMVCACKVISWNEYIDFEKFGKQLINPWDNVILSCVAWIKDEYFEKYWYFEVVIQKII